MDPNQSDDERNNFSEVDDETDMWFIMQAYEYDRRLQEEKNLPRMTHNPINHDWEDAKIRLMGDYFDDHCIKSCEVDPLPKHFHCFTHRPDATGQMSMSVIMKCTSTIRQLAYDNTPNAFDEYLQMGEHTVRDCLDNFNKCIIDLYMSKYLREPTLEDVEKMHETQENIHGFLGMQEALIKTPTTRKSMSSEAIENLIAQCVADTLATYKTNQNNGNGNENGNENGNRNGSGSQCDGRSGSRRTVHMARGCMYKEFLNCQPLNFTGFERAAGLARWFEKMEYVFHFSNCVVEYQVKYATCTLLNGALTWWNSHKLESELWNLTVKGTDVVGYTQRFQKLGLLCLRTVPKKEDKVERYIWGLPDSIKTNVTSTRTTRLQDTVKLANSLMDKKIYVFAARQADNKRRMRTIQGTTMFNNHPTRGRT
ncbi:hypothetical protein Tco_1546279 [Tanacetum coccineum]